MASKENVSNAIHNFLKGQQRDLDLVVRQLQLPTCSDSDMADRLSQLKNCVCMLDQQRFELVVGALLTIEWTNKSSETIRVYQSFIINLVSAHSIYTHAVLKALVSLFTPRSKHYNDDQFDADSRGTFDAEMRNVHCLIVSVIKAVPMAVQNLPRIITEKFPYVLHKESVFIDLYMQNILQITVYCPTIRSTVLSLIVEKLIFLDVRACRERIEDAESDSEDELEDMEVFQMEADTPKKEKVLKNNLSEADRLDNAMCIVYTYIDKTCKNKDGNLNWDSTKNLYLELLTIFEKIVLPTHECCHTQFLLFYVCSLKQNLADGFMDYLWKKVKNPSEHVVYRKSAICYMASFIVRAKYVSIRSAADAITLMCEWIHKYILTANHNSMHCDITHHGSFYAVVQSVMYMLAFRQKEFLDMGDANTFFTSLGLQNIVTCKLNPLRVCQPVITKTFSAFVRKHQLAFCDAIIERNNRMVIPTGDFNGEGASQYLESYFPFDPYLLVRSEGRISDIYRMFDGHIITEIPHTKVMVDDDDDDFVENDENQMSTSYVKSPSAEAFLGSVSPGFNITSLLQPPR